MKILYIVRENYKNIFGGDVVQFSKTRNALIENFGVDIQIAGVDELENINTEQYDIIHYWGITNLNEKILNLEKNKKCKHIISSIFWDFTDAIMINYMYKIWEIIPNNIYNLVKKILVYISKNLLYNIIPQYSKRKQSLFLADDCKNLTRALLNNSDIIIPNSYEEGACLCNYCNEDYKTNKNKFIPIPNAIDLDYIKAHKDTDYMNNIKDFVLVSARIEALKNQLGVLSALKDNPEIPIIFAGSVGNKQEKYCEKIKKIADKRGNVYFTEKLSPDDLFSLYKRAKVHVLASFRESPGLSTIEALMCGCQIVVSDERFCPIKYYRFDKYGFVCNPYDTKSIKNAILEAYNNPKDINLTEEYIRFFSYENVAKMTYEVYKKIMGE